MCKVGILDKKNSARKKAEILDSGKIDNQINTLEMNLFIRQVVELFEMYKHNWSKRITQNEYSSLGFYYIFTYIP